MGAKLLTYYKLVSEVAGMKGSMELAKLTKLPSTRAALEPDSPENLKLFRDAVAKITGKPAPSV